MSKQVLNIENTIRLYQYLRDRLKYLQPSVCSLIKQAASSGEFRNLSFLLDCDDKMQNGQDFSWSWRTSLAQSGVLLGKEAEMIVAGLADVLGASDLESQLSALDYGRAVLESRLADTREYAARHRKLYQTLGVLAGLGIAILIY